MKNILLTVVAAVSLAVFGGEKLTIAVVDTCPTNGSVKVEGRYFRAFEKVGHTAFVLPRTGSSESIAKLLKNCDLVLFCGGEDVDPKRYGEAPSPKLGTVNRRRDEFEWKVLDEAVKVRKPVAGICRGCQLINCYFGGTLYQDIPSEIGTNVVHRWSAHYMTPEKGSRLAKVMGEGRFRGPSWHHQSVEKLAEGFRVAARSDDGVVECIEGDAYPAFGVQFHPEKGCDPECPVGTLYKLIAELSSLACVPTEK